MFPEPDFPVSLTALKQELLSNTHSLRIIVEGIELNISLPDETSSNYQLAGRNSAPQKRRLLFHILLEGSRFDVNLPDCFVEELAYMNGPNYRIPSKWISTLSGVSIPFVLLQGRKLDVTHTVATLPEHKQFQNLCQSFPLERQYIFQINLPDKTLDVSMAPSSSTFLVISTSHMTLLLYYIVFWERRRATRLL